MGLLSSLALVVIPLIRREVVPVVSETARLKAELEASRAEVERLRAEILQWMDLTQTWRQRCEHAEARLQQSTGQWLQAQSCAQSAQYAQLQADRYPQWHHCDCTPPGRNALFQRGLGA